MLESCSETSKNRKVRVQYINLGGRVAVIIIKVLILLSYDINIILSYK